MTSLHSRILAWLFTPHAHDSFPMFTHEKTLPFWDTGTVSGFTVL